jgi:DNA-binding MarR family transcriptional regulator
VAEEDWNIGLLCFVVYRAMETRVLEAMAQSGFGDVTAAQGRVFARIGTAGSRLTDLAEQAQVSKQTAGFLVDQLENAGYVERVADPTDGRARLVRIADRGRRAVAVARRVEAEVEAEWTRYLGVAGARSLRRQLTRLREITDPYADRDQPVRRRS